MAQPSADLTNSSVSDAINEHSLTDLILERTLSRFMNNLVICRNMRQEESAVFATGQYGEQISIRRPYQFYVREGRKAEFQRLEEGTWAIKLDTQAGNEFNVTGFEKALKIPQFYNDVVDPAVASIEQYIEEKAAMMYQGLHHYVDFTGTTATTVSKRSEIAQCVSALTKLGVPRMNLQGYLTEESMNAIEDEFITLDSERRIEAGYAEQAMVRPIVGINFHRSQVIATHTVGAYGSGSLRVNGANQYHDLASGSSSNDLDTQTLALDGFTASTDDVLNKGDIIKIAGIKKVNLVSGKKDGKMVQTDDMSFTVVSSDNDSNGSGEVEIDVRPAMVREGPYQNVSAAPADNAAVTVVGAAGSTRKECLLFRPDAHSFVMTAAPDIGPNIGYARRRAQNLGVRVMHYGDGDNDVEKVRLDILFGFTRLDGQNGLRILTSK